MEQQVEHRDFRAEGRLVASRAARNKDFPAAARWVAGAVNDVYERLASGLLEETAEKAAGRGMTVEQHQAAIESAVLLSAAETVVAHHRNNQAPAKGRRSRRARP